MKRTLFLIVALAFAFTLSAQAPHRGDGKKESIEEIVTDLTPQQKSRIDAITQRSSKNVEKYRSQLKTVRDSIKLYMNRRDDNSAKVFPLYDREARIRAELSKEYYRTKVAIDAVLTPEQFRLFQQNMEKKRHGRRK